MEKPALTKRLFSLRVKLLALLGFLSIIFLGAAYASFYGLDQVDKSSAVITERETPFVRSIEGALISMVESQFAAEHALDLDEEAQLSALTELNNTFQTANLRFDMFVAAITWGSESEAFKKSDGGRNYRSWIDAGNAGTLIVQESSAAQTGNAGRVGVYFAGYVNNVQRAIEEREHYIILKTSDPKAAESARTLSKDFQEKARRFADLTAEHLDQMIQLSNEATAESAAALGETKERVRLFTIITTILWLAVSIGVGLFFAEMVIVKPVHALVKTANAIGSGKFTERVTINSNDELSLLGRAFNDMSDKLATYTSNLEQEVARRTEELRAANDRLTELDKVKTEFISVAAHQLRTPLSALKWVLRIVIDENAQNLTDEQRTMLMKGYESNERMISLINEMLIVTRIESGKERYILAPVHIEDVIDSVILDFSGQAYVRKIKLAFERPATQLPFIKADAEKMRAVLQNLIENAMRYTLDGGAITLKAWLDGNFVKTSVTDTGIGIPKHQMSGIFNKFFRADNAVKLQTDGSGLGLFISKRMVELHGGTMTFMSEENKGTTFEFSVPMSGHIPTRHRTS